MTIEEARQALGHRVTYASHPAVSAAEQEHGRITEIYSRFAFVQYDGKGRPLATAPELLTDDGDA